MPLKLISLNIEGRKHLDNIIPFLESEAPDVLCLQELCDVDVGAFEALDMQGFFAPMSYEGEHAYGLGLFSKLSIKHFASCQYGGSQDPKPQYDNENMQARHDSQRYMLLSCEIEKSGELYCIATTHFPVTEQGRATDYQRTDMRGLLAVLKNLGEFVLCGDFNAPRGGEIFAMLAGKYQDHIPPHCATSLDLELHRAGKTHPEELATKMVDGLFSTPGYAVSDARLQGGVSDHCAIVAAISLKV